VLDGTHVTSESSFLGGGYQGYYAFDGNYGQFWHSAIGVYSNGYTGSASTVVSDITRTGEWVEIQFPKRIHVQKFSLSPRVDHSYRMPSTMTIAGSTNGTTWTELGRFTGVVQTEYVYQQDTFFDTSTTGYYSYIRLIAEKIIGDSSIQITQFKIFGSVLDEDDWSGGELQMTGGYLKWPYAGAAGFQFRVVDGYFDDDVSYFDNPGLTELATGFTTDMTNILTSTNGYIPLEYTQSTYSVQWIGLFQASTTGTYTFYTNSDDASYLWIGPAAKTGYTASNALVQNPLTHPMQKRSGSVTLVQDTVYSIRIQFGENEGGDDCIVSYTPPGGSETTDWSSVLVSPFLMGLSTRDIVGYPVPSYPGPVLWEESPVLGTTYGPLYLKRTQGITVLVCLEYTSAIPGNDEYFFDAGDVAVYQSSTNITGYVDLSGNYVAYGGQFVTGQTKSKSVYGIRFDPDTNTLSSITYGIQLNARSDIPSVTDYLASTVAIGMKVDGTLAMTGTIHSIGVWNAALPFDVMQTYSQKMIDNSIDRSVSGSYADALTINNVSTLLMTKGSAVENPDLGGAQGSGLTGPFELDGYIVDSSSSWPGNNPPSTGTFPIYAFNKSYTGAVNDIWGGGSLPDWIRIRYPTNVLVKEYSITSRADLTNTYPPHTWNLEGSNDGVDWVILDHQYRVGTAFSPGKTITFQLQETHSAYTQYRLYITESLYQNTTTINTQYVAISEWRLFTYPSSSVTLTQRHTLKQPQASRIVQTKPMPARGISYDALISLVAVSRKDLLTTLSGSPTSIADQVSGVWNFGGTVTPSLDEGVPCLDMDGGYMELPSTGATLGQEYTVFYYWKPVLAATNWRTLHRNDNDHIVIVQSGDGAPGLGIYSNRDGGFRDTGYDVLPGVWQTLIVTNVGDTSTSTTGTGTFYVNNTLVGTTDRVGCGTRLRWIGLSSQPPGKVAVAGAFNRLLSRREITKMHRTLQNWGRRRFASQIPKAVGRSSIITPILTGSACIFALRRIPTTYSMPQLRLRRTSDGSELDVFYDAFGGLITNISSWIGGSSASVSLWYDQSGNGNHAQASTGTVSLDTQKNALYFDGSSTLQIPHSPSSMDFSLAQTISIRMEPTSTMDSSRRNPYNQAYGGPGTWTIEGSAGSPGQINYFFGTNGADAGPYSYIRSSVLVQTNVKTHITTIRDQRKNKSVFYKDGVKDVTGAAGGYAQTANGTQPITLGDGYVSNYIGYMDFVCVLRSASANDLMFLQVLR
jgi:hypothetical protein